MQAPNSTIVLRVQLDEEKTEDRLKALVLSIEKTRASQTLLNNSRKLGNVEADVFATKTVELTNRLSDQLAEQRNLTKDLQLYRGAVSGTGTSYKELQSALSLAQRQFQVLEGSADNGTESAQELSKTIESLRLRLKATDEVQQNFSRNIGNYPKNDSLQKLVQQLVTLQEQEKRTTAGTEEAIKVRQEIGFVQQAAIQRGAAEGKTYEQTTSFLRTYSDALRPATADLLRLTEEQQALATSGEDVTEEVSKIGFQIAALGKQIKDTPAELPEIQVPTGSLEELAQGLVKIREEQKGVATDSAAFQQAEREIKAYEAAAVSAGTEAGLSYEQAQQRLGKYTASVQPLVAALVKLEAEQAEVEKGSEAYLKLQARISQATQALDKASKPAKNLSGEILNAGRNTELFGGIIGKATEYQEKFSQAQAVAKIAIGGNVTALGFLRLALLATGLGALVVILGSVVTYLGRTQEGTAKVNQVLGGLAAVVKVVTNLAADFGGKLVKAAEDPKQAFLDLLGFLESQVVNRIKSVGVLIDGIKTGNISKIGDSFIQAATGITDGTQKLKGFGAQVNAAADAGARLSKMQRQLERDTNDNIDTNKRLLNEVERLRNVRDNEFNTLAVRKKANEDAYKVELQREAALVKLAREKIAVRKAELDQAGGRERDEEAFKAFKEANQELKDIQEDAAGKQNELITNRFQLTKDGLDKEKDLTAKALDKRIALRKDALALEAAILDRQLKQVQTNSDEELSLLQQKLRNGMQAELNVKALTASAKKVIDEKYENDSLALTLDFNRRRLLAALQGEADLTAAELASRQNAGADELRRLGEQQKTTLQLKAEQIEQQRQLAIAGLAANADNDAKIQAINAQAAAQRQKLEYDEAVRLLQVHLDAKRRLIENDYADGLILEAEYQRRLAAVAKAGTELQADINKDYQQDNTANQKQADDLDTAARRQHTAEVKKEEEVKQQIREATIQAAINHTDTIIKLFGEESAAGQAANAIKKVLAISEIYMNLQKELSANKLTAAQIKAFIPPPAGIALGIAYEIAADAVSITAAAAQAAEILKLQRGGLADVRDGQLVQGPSHAQGGVQVYHRGRHAGIEIEGGEAVMTKNVAAQPLLLTIASAVNQLAGGRSLISGRAAVSHMALGGLTATNAAPQLLIAPPAPIDYQLLAKSVGLSVSDSLRRNPPRTVFQDFKDAEYRNAETDRFSNFK